MPLPLHAFGTHPSARLCCAGLRALFTRACFCSCLLCAAACCVQCTAAAPVACAAASSPVQAAGVAEDSQLCTAGWCHVSGHRTARTAQQPTHVPLQPSALFATMHVTDTDAFQYYVFPISCCCLYSRAIRQHDVACSLVLGLCKGAHSRTGSRRAGVTGVCLCGRTAAGINSLWRSTTAMVQHRCFWCFHTWPLVTYVVA